MRTVKSLKTTEAQRLGIADRLLPVIQGWTAADYLYCLERMPIAKMPAVIGIGSMCRREVSGPEGVVETLDAIDRELGSDPVRVHLFGVKTTAAEAVRGHPRVASFDSQAYGSEARDRAFKINRTAAAAGCDVKFSKSNRFVADVMEGWVSRQNERLAKPGWQFQTSLGLFQPEPPPADPIEAKIAQIREKLRELVSTGELEHDDVTPAYIEAWLADWDEDPDAIDLARAA